MRKILILVPLLMAGPAFAQSSYGSGVTERILRDERLMDQAFQACQQGNNSGCAEFDRIQRSWANAGARADATMRQQQFQDHVRNDLQQRQERQSAQDWASFYRQQGQQALSNMRGSRTPQDAEYWANQAQRYEKQAKQTEPKRGNGWWPW